MKLRPALLARSLAPSLALSLLPAIALAQSAPALVPAPALGPSALSLENRTALRCSAAFAIVADGQARGKQDALAYPALDTRGREFFVRASARAMDDTGLDRAAVAAALQTEARALWAKGGIGGEIDQIMPACLLLLEASGI